MASDPSFRPDPELEAARLETAITGLHRLRQKREDDAAAARFDAECIGLVLIELAKRLTEVKR